jgi:hypothetical protein
MAWMSRLLGIGSVALALQVLPPPSARAQDCVRPDCIRLQETACTRPDCGRTELAVSVDGCATGECLQQSPLVSRDECTGSNCLRAPVPAPDECADQHCVRPKAD